MGDFRGGSSPSTTCKSVRHTPHACTRTRISPRPGRGTAISVNLRGLLSIGAGASSRQAFTSLPHDPGLSRPILILSPKAILERLKYLSCKASHLYQISE